MTTRPSTTFSASLFGLLGLALVASPTEASPLTSTSLEDRQPCGQNGPVSHAPNSQQSQAVVFVPQPVLAVEKNSALKPNFSDRSAQPLQPELKNTISAPHIASSNAVVETASYSQVQAETETASASSASVSALESNSGKITSSNAVVEPAPEPEVQAEAETASASSASVSALESNSGKITSPNAVVEPASYSQVRAEAETASSLSASTLESRAGNALTHPKLDSKPALPESELAPSLEASVSTRSWAEELPPEAVPTSHVYLPPSKQKRPSLLSVAWNQLRTSDGRTERPLAADDGLANRNQEKPKLLIAQASPNAETTQPTNPDDLRQELQIEPLAANATPTVAYPPSPNAGIPSAFGASWGDAFVGLTASGADRVRRQVDGSISLGLGLGDPNTAVGVELAYNLLSIRRFAQNGSFDVKVHRSVFADETTQVAAAVGLNNFANYGSNVAGTQSSLYGVVSAAYLLQPEDDVNRMPITGTLGLGGGYFRQGNSDVGVIAGVGVQVAPQVSVNTAWSGVGLNVGASVVPVSTIPLTINLLYGDITNNTQAGSVLALSINYGFNFAPRFGP
ncbi:MAG TPA: hypothetical protein V6D29_16575 [Leptolyngbyaceae cyanobacterium]